MIFFNHKNHKIFPQKFYTIQYQISLFWIISKVGVTIHTKIWIPIHSRTGQTLATPTYRGGSLVKCLCRTACQLVEVKGLTVLTSYIHVGVVTMRFIICHLTCYDRQFDVACLCHNPITVDLGKREKLHKVACKKANSIDRSVACITS